MFNQMMKDVLAAYGPSGREKTVANVIKGYVEPWCDEVYTDALGNLFAHKKGTSGKKVMVSAHMDQIGLIVIDIDDEGFLHVSNVGGVSPTVSVAREVRFENGVHGVTYFENKKKTHKDAAMGDIFVDIGAKDRAEAEARVSIGDVGVYVTNFIEMGRKISSGALDNRICCVAIMEALRTMKTEHDIYAVFTVQEEVGCRGSGAAAYSVNPDFAVNLDVTLCGDMPECTRMAVKLGEGPTVKVMDSSVVVPAIVRDFMTGVAKKNDIKYQNEVLRAGGTDTSSIQRTRDGILAGCISVATRYIHTPVETCDLDDVMGAVKLLNAIVAEKELPTVK